MKQLRSNSKSSGEVAQPPSPETDAEPADRKRPVWRLHLHPFGWTIDFVDCKRLADDFCGITRGWNFQLERLPASGPVMPEPADARITRTRNNYLWHEGARNGPRYWDNSVHTSHFDAICDIHDVLFDWYLHDRRDHLCLHGAAVELAGRLVCFPSVSKAGKSTLCGELAALGRTVFCDDVLPLEPEADHGVALGFLPRLRNPLAPNATGRFRKLVRERPAPANDEWQYLGLRTGELAPLGKAAPVAAFILLERDAGAELQLEPVGQEVILREVISQNFSFALPAIEVLDRFIALTANAECHRLVYDRPEEAARFLIERYEGSGTMEAK